MHFIYEKTSRPQIILQFIFFLNSPCSSFRAKASLSLPHLVVASVCRVYNMESNLTVPIIFFCSSNDSWLFAWSLVFFFTWIHVLCNIDEFLPFKFIPVTAWPILQKIYTRSNLYKPFNIAIYAGDAKPSSFYEYSEQQISNFSYIFCLRCTRKGLSEGYYWLQVQVY